MRHDRAKRYIMINTHFAIGWTNTLKRGNSDDITKKRSKYLLRAWTKKACKGYPIKSERKQQQAAVGVDTTRAPRVRLHTREFDEFDFTTTTLQVNGISSQQDMDIIKED